MKRANTETDPRSSTASLAARLRDWNDAEAWAEFNADYRRPVCRRALRAGLDETEAQDVFQETSVAVAIGVVGLAASAAFGAWVFRIARRRIADALRARAVVARVIAEAAEIQAATGLDEVPDPHGTPCETLCDRECREAVVQALCKRMRGCLGPKMSQVFELCWLQGWSAARVAAALDWPLDRVYRAKYKVLGCVKQEAARLAGGRIRLSGGNKADNGLACAAPYAPQRSIYYAVRPKTPANIHNFSRGDSLIHLRPKV